MSAISDTRDEGRVDEQEDKKLELENHSKESEVERSEDQGLNKESHNSSKMLVNDNYISPERRQYHSFNASPPFLKNKAETYVTRSMVDKYGPIVSPTISPTRPIENSEARLLRERSPINVLGMKTDRDYETATLICSIADSANNLQKNMRELTSSSVDTLRVSRISTLLGFSSPAIKDFSNSGSNRGKPNHYIKHEHTRHNNVIEHVSTDDANAREYRNGKDDAVKNDQSYVITNSTTPDDTDDSEYENDDNSMIVRPRDPENGECGENGYTCRLPCCTRIGYSAQISPDGSTHSPIRVPARRPGQFSKECHHSESEHSKCFTRHRDSNKSAFSTVSPTKKRPETEFSYSSMPAIKVRVIKETNPTTEDNHIRDIKKEGESENTSTVVHHHRDIIIKTESDIQPTHHHPNSREGSNNFEVRKENNSYQPMTLTNGVLSQKSIFENSVFTQSFMKENNLLLARTSSVHVSGHSANFSSVFSPPFSAGLAFIKCESSPNGIANHVVQCSTVDSTATADNAEGESRLMDLARIANEQLGEELAKQQPLKKGKPKSNDCLHLWEFLRDILNNESMAPRAIEWTIKERGEFRLIKTGVVAQLWGLSKNRTSMTYEKMARAMRYYYKMKILEKVPHKRLHFRFGKHMLPKVLVSKE